MLARFISSAYIGAVGRIDPALLVEFKAAARRPLAVRWRYSFIRTCKPAHGLVILAPQHPQRTDVREPSLLDQSRP